MLLSHGQATVERGFSVNRQIEVENLKERGIVAQRVIQDYIRCVGGVDQVVVDKAMLVAAASARQRYHDYLDEEKKNQAEEAKQKTKRKLLEDLEEIKSKRKRLTDDISSLFKTADDFANAAEKKGDLTLIAKSNSLRRTAKRKEEELQKVEENLNEK